MTSTDDITVRELHEPAEFAACVKLQRETWGESFSEVVPPAILQVAQKVGGITAGAFDKAELVGFVFGLTGMQHGRPLHWSDMLAVRASHRNRGIGEQLKWYQRAKLLERGVERMCWTFDPLDAKNAYLNFCRLGVISREYVVDMYGATDSPLHAAGTDRLVVIWEMSSARVTTCASRAAPAALPADARIEIPTDIHDINRAHPTAVREWRNRTRALFRKYLPDYVVTGFERGENSCFYALTSASNFAE